jgi:hypothetical protein
MSDEPPPPYQPPPASNTVVHPSTPTMTNPTTPTTFGLTPDLANLVDSGDLTIEQAQLMFLGVSVNSSSSPPPPPPPPTAKQQPPLTPSKPTSIFPTLPNDEEESSSSRRMNDDEESSIADRWDYEPEVVVEMLREEKLSGHLRTICNAIANTEADMAAIDVAVRRATIQCFAAVNEVRVCFLFFFFLSLFFSSSSVFFFFWQLKHKLIKA